MGVQHCISVQGKMMRRGEWEKIVLGKYIRGGGEKCFLKIIKSMQVTLSSKVKIYTEDAKLRELLNVQPKCKTEFN